MLTMSLLFEGGATPNCATLQRLRLFCSRCKSRFQLPTFALPMLSHPALCSPVVGFFQTTRMSSCIIVCALGITNKGETPQKREVFCRVSNILCRSLDTHIWIASLPDDCAAKICIKIKTSKSELRSVKCKKYCLFGHIGQYRSIYMTT